MNNLNSKKRKRIPKSCPGKRVPAIVDPSTTEIPVTAAAAPNRNTDNAGNVTADGVVQCRFTLFVVLRTGVISPFKDLQRAWCFRGDRFTDHEPKMLRNLLNLAKKQVADYFTMIFFDNSFPKNNERNVIMKVQDGKVKPGNRLKDYADMLSEYPLPDWLKPHMQ